MSASPHVTTLKDDGIICFHFSPDKNLMSEWGLMTWASFSHKHGKWQTLLLDVYEKPNHYVQLFLASMQVNKNSSVPSWYLMGHYGMLSKCVQHRVVQLLLVRPVGWSTVLWSQCYGSGQFEFLCSMATDFTTSLSQLPRKYAPLVTKQTGWENADESVQIFHHN